MILAPITAGQRRFVLRWAICLCTGPVVLLPLAARSGPALLSPNVLPSPMAVPVTTAERPAAPIVIGRDPFAGGEDEARPSAANAGAAASGTVGTQVTQGAAIDGAPPLATPVAQDVTLLATIVGTKRLALILEAGQSRVLGIGETVAGARVVAISRDGLTLSNGRFVAVEAARP